MEAILGSRVVRFAFLDGFSSYSLCHFNRVKKGVPGEKYLGKDHEGWEYTSHDLWKKKLVWKSAWKKIWVPSKKTVWVPNKKLTWIEDYKKIYKTAKQQIWVDDKKLAWKEAWKQIWRTDKQQIWVPDKKLTWVEAWSQYYKPSKKLEHVPDKKLTWKEAWKQIWVRSECDELCCMLLTEKSSSSGARLEGDLAASMEENLEASRHLRVVPHAGPPRRSPSPRRARVRRARMGSKRHN